MTFAVDWALKANALSIYSFGVAWFCIKRPTVMFTAIETGFEKHMHCVIQRSLILSISASPTLMSTLKQVLRSASIPTGVL